MHTFVYVFLLLFSIVATIFEATKMAASGPQRNRNVNKCTHCIVVDQDSLKPDNFTCHNNRTRQVNGTIYSCFFNPLNDIPICKTVHLGELQLWQQMGQTQSPWFFKYCSIRECKIILGNTTSNFKKSTGNFRFAPFNIMSIPTFVEYSWVLEHGYSLLKPQ
jgi:hypothetical protein